MNPPLPSNESKVIETERDYIRSYAGLHHY